MKFHYTMLFLFYAMMMLAQNFASHQNISAGMAIWGLMFISLSVVVLSFQIKYRNK